MKEDVIGNGGRRVDVVTMVTQVRLLLVMTSKQSEVIRRSRVTLNN